MKPSLSATVALATAGIAVFTLGLLALLDVLNFDRDLAALVAARRSGIAADLAGEAEAGLALGATVGELRGADDLSAMLRRRHADLLRVDLADRSGVVRQSTDPAVAGRRTAESVLSGAARLERTLVNNFGLPAGSLRVSFDDGVVADTRFRVRARIRIALLLHVLLVALLAGWSARRLSRELRRDVERAVRRIAPAAAPPEGEPRGAVETAAAAFAAACREARETLR